MERSCLCVTREVSGNQDVDLNSANGARKVNNARNDGPAVMQRHIPERLPTRSADGRRFERFTMVPKTGLIVPG